MSFRLRAIFAAGAPTSRNGQDGCVQLGHRVGLGNHLGRGRTSSTPSPFAGIALVPAPRLFTYKAVLLGARVALAPNEKQSWLLIPFKRNVAK